MSDVENGDWQRLKLFTGFNKLAFHRRDSSFECFNWSTQNYGLCRCEKWFLSLVSLTMMKNKRRGVNVPWLSQGWHRSVGFFWKKNTLSFAILYIIASCASLCLSSRLRQFKRSNMSSKYPPTNFKAHLRRILFGWYTARTNICRAGHMNEPWPRDPNMCHAVI